MMNSPMVRQMMRAWKMRARLIQREAEGDGGIGEFIWKPMSLRGGLTLSASQRGNPDEAILCIRGLLGPFGARSDMHKAYRASFPVSRERVPVKVGKVSRRDFLLIREPALTSAGSRGCIL